VHLSKYHAGDQLKKNKKAGACGTDGEKRIKDFGGKAKGKKDLGRPKNR